MTFNTRPAGFGRFDIPDLEDRADARKYQLAIELGVLCESISPEEVPFYDKDREQTVPALSEYIGFVSQLLECNSDRLGRDIDQELLARAINGPCHFALTVGLSLLDHPVRLDCEKLPRSLGYIDALDVLSETAASYLEEHPVLTELIDGFSHELTPGREYRQVVELVSATTFMAIETAEEKRVSELVDQEFEALIKGSGD